MIYILYSADYELFLGKNYAPESEVLIQPTFDLLRTCGEMGIHMTLFVDTCCLQRYRQLGLHDFPDRVEDQVRSAVTGGHDIQTHLHPHWLFASIHDGAYSFDRDKFLLGRLSPDPGECLKMVSGYLEKSRTCLTRILRPVNPSYRCMSFRAGGYGLQPNTRLILQALQDTGYLIDSSIVPDLVSKTDVNEIDYRHVPRRANYWLSARTDLAGAEQNSDGIFEIPIASWRFHFLERWPHLVRLGLESRRRKRLKISPKGVPIQGWGPGGVRDTLQGIFSPRLDYLDLHVDPSHLFRVTKKYLTYYSNSPGDIFFSFNMHPKVMREENLGALKRYHRLLFEHYGESIRSITFQEAGGLIPKGREELAID